LRTLKGDKRREREKGIRREAVQKQNERPVCTGAVGGRAAGKCYEKTANYEVGGRKTMMQSGGKMRRLEGDKGFRERGGSASHMGKQKKKG